MAARPSFRAASALKNIATPFISRPAALSSRFPAIIDANASRRGVATDAKDVPQHTKVAETVKKLEDQLKEVPPTHTRNLFDLSGKVYVVTGGGRGLGLVLAEALAEAGAAGKST